MASYARPPVVGARWPPSGHACREPPQTQGDHALPKQLAPVLPTAVRAVVSQIRTARASIERVRLCCAARNAKSRNCAQQGKRLPPSAQQHDRTDNNETGSEDPAAGLVRKRPARAALEAEHGSASAGGSGAVTAFRTLQLSGAGASGGPIRGMSSLGLALTAPVGVHLANGREPDVMSAGSPAIRASRNGISSRSGSLPPPPRLRRRSECLDHAGRPTAGAGPDEPANRRTVD